MKICPRLNTLHQSSTLASISWCEISETTLIQGKTRELRLNFSTLQQTCRIVYETLVCQRRWWLRRRGGARPAAQQHLCFQSLQGWGGPSFPHSSNSAQFLEAFCVVLHIAKNCHHHNIINITNLGNNFQYSMDRKVEVKNVFVMSTLTSWCL